MADNIRCEWPGGDLLMIKYHDNEWGIPCHDDKKLFEYLTLDGFQAGLSWRTILYKRENFRKAFHDFNPVKISRYGQEDAKRLMSNAGIIRNKLKILGAIENAKRFLDIQKEFGSFDKYIWQFTNNQTIKNNFVDMRELSATAKESDAMSRDMKKRGFKFVGSTVCYAFMQAAGMVNDHTIKCFRYNKI